MPLETKSSQCIVLVDGAPLSPLVSPHLVYAEVDSTVFVPSQFKLVFRGFPDQILLPGGLQLAALVIVSASDDGAPIPLITGEITAVEVEYDMGETLTIVRGADRANRLMRGTKSRSMPDMTASAMVTLMLGESGVIPGEIIPTSTIYPTLSQANISDWAFIQQLAALENYVAYSDAEGLFNFGPMTSPEVGMPPALTYDMPPEGTQLVMGSNLIRMRAVVTSAEQVPAVTVGGYAPDEAIPVISPFPLVPSTSQGTDPAVLPPLVAGEFGAEPFFESSRPFDDEGSAEKWAESVAADIAGAMAELEAECEGNPSLLAGKSVTLGMAGLPFDGYYVCTAARHVFDPAGSGYKTWVTVGGRRDRSLYALTSGAPPAATSRPTVPGLVMGTVINNLDPEEKARVQVMFPWLGSPEYISAWARVMQIGAGKAGAGFLWMPEVGDEVLIGFDRGSMDHPYVIGNLYNGLAAPMPPPSIEGVVASRRIASRMAHTIEWNDGPEKMGISIMTAPAEAPPTSIVLDGEQVKVTVNSLGQIEITGTAEVKISSEGALSIDAPSISIGSEDTLSLSMAGTSVSIGGESCATLSVGSPSTASVSVSGAMISLGGA